MRIFITGATGFIGSHVAHHLLRCDHELVVLARTRDKTPSLSQHPSVRRVLGTLYDAELIRQNLEGCDACIHIALGWGDDPLAMLQTDTTATISLLQACVEAKVSQFLYTSSTAAIGPFTSRMNETSPLRPSDYYGATKAASEAFVLAVGSREAMRCNVIRPGYTFGNPAAPEAPTQPDQRFAQIARAAATGESIRVEKGDGTQFVAAGDLAKLYEAVLLSQCNREVFLGLATPYVTWQGVAEQAIRLAESSSTVVVEGEGSPTCLFDLSKIREEFGLEFDSDPAIAEHLTYLMAKVGDQ